jgi:hypothetical protein
MLLTRITIITIALILGRAGMSFAQGAASASSDSANCDAELNAPTRDSALVQYDALFAPFDSAQHLPVSFREMLGEGLRQELRLPRPLVVNTYTNNARFVVADPDHGDYAIATLRSVYRFVLHRNGRLTNVRAVGGVRNAAFENSIIGALARLDSEQLLPTPPDSTGFDHDSLDIRLTITPGAIARSQFMGPPPTPSGSTPLFRLRLPVRPIEKDAAPMPNQPHPRYPPSMRDQHIEGQGLAQFVVRPSGDVDPSSIQFLKATRLEFASAVVQVLPSMHFFPMQIAGCKVATLVQMPFVFGLGYPSEAPPFPNR